MATLEDVDLLAQAFPSVTVGERRGNRTWSVGGKAFCWDRPYTKADLRRFGEATPPAEPLVAVRTADLEAKEVLLASGQPGLFTMEHFDGFPAVLIQVDAVELVTLSEVLTDGWLAMAPPALVADYLASSADT